MISALRLSEMMAVRGKEIVRPTILNQTEVKWKQIPELMSGRYEHVDLTCLALLS